MRIAVVTDERTVPFAQVTSLAATLDSHGHTPTVFRTADSAADEGDAAARLVDELRTAWAEEPPEVAHAIGSTAELATLATEHEEIPLVHDDRYAVGATDPERARLQVALAKRAEQTLVGGHSHADQLIRHGVPRGSITIVPHGIDLGVFTTEGPERPHQTRYRLVGVGDLADPAVDDVLDAMPWLRGAELLLPGADSGADRTSAAARIVARAEELGVADRVLVCPDLDATDRAALYRSADLGIAGSDAASAGHEMLRAMACGLPLFAPNAAVDHDYIVPGVTGEIESGGGTRRLAAVIHRLLTDEPRRAAYGIAGADRVTSCYTPDRVGRAAETAYTAAISHGRFTVGTVAGRYRATA